MPGITTIAKTSVMPATKEHNSADEIKDISNIFILFPLNSGWWFTGDVINHSGNLWYLINDSVRNFV